MAQLLGQVNVGTVVKLNENGNPTDYLVVHQGKPSSLYDDSCDGTWLLRKDIYANQPWNSSNNNTFTSATINATYLPSLLALYDTYIQPAIKTVKIPYCVGNGNSTVNSGASGYSCQLFLLSGYEVGWTTSTSSYFPVDGAKLSYFEAGTGSSANNKRIAKLNDNATYWWLRSPITGNTSNVWYVNSNGDYRNINAGDSYGVRPAMILPTTLIVESDGTITTAPDLSIYIPSNAMQGQPIPISWSVVSNAQSYQLQRNTGSSWETIYTGAEASFTDTAGGDWTTVQYQVAVSTDGSSYGAYIQSDTITVVPASTLVISGQDGDLGIITADIGYTVTSDTGNQISLVRTVNGIQYGARTVGSGFAYNIPVMELPTGTGTIVIKATVQASTGSVTVTRTWTYTKTPINFTNSGSVGSLSVNGQTVLPTTLAEAVRTSPVWGGSLDLALQELSNAALYKTSAPTQEIGTLAEGTIIYLNENGSPVPFYVAKQNYEPEHNTNRTLVVRKDVVTRGQWNSSGVNTYDGSTIDTWFNSTYLNTLDSNVQTAIGTTNIPATSPYNSGVIRLEKGVFALSATELGKTGANFNTEGSPLSISNILEIAQLNGSNTEQWTRTPITSGTRYAVPMSVIGGAGNSACESNFGYRPAFTLPSDFTAYLDEPTTGLFDIQNNLLLSLPGSGGTGFAQIETGSYTGTGTYGSGNPNSLTFGFVPQLLVVQLRSSSGRVNGIWLGLFSPSLYTESYSDMAYRYGLGSATDDCHAKRTETTVYWYSTSAPDQFNNSNQKYTYFAIG